MGVLGRKFSWSEGPEGISRKSITVVSYEMGRFLGTSGGGVDMEGCSFLC